MPTKTKKANTNEVNAAKTNQNNQEQEVKQTAQPEKQSQLATILVGLLIIASGLLVYNYFQRTSAPDTTNQTEQQKEQAKNDSQKSQDKNKDEEKKNESNEGQYTVEQGDTLWSIAEQVYGDGNQWHKIADANQLSLNANGQPDIEIGQTLIVPESAAVAQKPQEEQKPEESKTAEEKSDDEQTVAGLQEVRQTPDTAIQTYTVKAGDSLWSIAENIYGNGEDWVLIFNDSHNHLGVLPDGRPLVHAGNVLYLPQAP